MSVLAARRRTNQCKRAASLAVLPLASSLAYEAMMNAQATDDIHCCTYYDKQPYTMIGDMCLF